MIIIAVIAILGIWAVGSYNGLVEKDETVKQVWGDVEACYQRRLDLIPNIVNSVKAYAKHEKSTLNEVTEARSKATGINVNIDNLDEETMKKYQDAQSQLSGSLSRLMAVAEAYPDLKANERYQQLISQLEGTENRINEARKKFNATVKPYNMAVRQFPGSICAAIFGFKTVAEFKADEGASKAPKVEFD